ncbi:MAG: hypothetical protein AMJ95_08360 [Omnitrophica WOR_2 bacterium SM23_72]|nr:MAG: hypothetical protein AMJ95_08360 [Omnitrophica WOR_2 bacterium SM23_72]
MNRNIILVWIILLALSLFIIFNYMPSMIELSALETENMLFQQLEARVKELEIRFVEPQVEDIAVKTTSIQSRKKFEKQIRATHTSEKKMLGKGSIIRGSVPLNPFNPDY